MGIGLVGELAGLGCGEERQGIVVGQAAHRPERLAPVEAHRAKGIGIGERPHRPRRQPRAGRERLDAAIALAAPLDDALRFRFLDAVGLAQAEAKRERIPPDPLQGVVPQAVADIDGADLDAMLLRVADDLRRGVEAHRLRIEQGAGEGRRDDGI